MHQSGPRGRNQASINSRVFLGLNEVAGVLSNLQAGLHDLGIRADLYDLSANLLGYGRRSAGASSLIRLASARRGTWQQRTWSLLRGAARVWKSLRTALILPWAALRYDTFVLEGRDLFLNGRGLWLLRRLNKRIVVLFLGSDHRPPYLNGVWLNEVGSADCGRARRDTRRIASRVRRAERYATAIVALPTSAQFHLRPFVHLLAIGLPTPTSGDFEPREPEPTLRILHCPTNVVAKGSREISAAVDHLRAEGYDIDLRLLHGVPHQVVLDALKDVDLVVDELYSDTPMAVFAAEAAAHGRPAIVGSYAWDKFDGAANGGWRPPTRMCQPDGLEAAIREMATDEDRRAKLGFDAYMFVKERWNPQAVARRVIDLAGSRVREEWLVDPKAIDYVHGWGTSSAALKDALSRLTKHCGTDWLELAARPGLKAKIAALAGSAEG